MWVNKLKCHIVKKHGDVVSSMSPVELGNQIYWRSKRGTRRCSYRAIISVLSEYSLPKDSRKNVIQIVRRILELCLVKIGSDSVL